MYTVKVIRSTRHLRKLYDQTNPKATAFNPLHFSLLLEESGSIIPTLGWTPHHFHFSLKEGGSLTIPAYSKNHSWGEFSFDHSWAEIAKEKKINYYPKLQICFPFMPTTTNYFNLNIKQENFFKKIIKEILEATQKEFSSIHITFPNDSCDELLISSGFVKTVHPQYIWENNKFITFSDFTKGLVSKRRCMIQKERELFQDLGMKTNFYSGKEINLKDLEEMYAIFERMHSNMNWGKQAFTLEFLELLFNRMREHLLIGFVTKKGARVAATLNFINSNTIYGRFWGSVEPSKYIHFELCYYSLIEYAIHNSYQKIEVGSTGNHKKKRGFIEKHGNNYHWISNSILKSAILEEIQKGLKN